MQRRHALLGRTACLAEPSAITHYAITRYVESLHACNLPRTPWRACDLPSAHLLTGGDSTLRSQPAIRPPLNGQGHEPKPSQAAQLARFNTRPGEDKELPGHTTSIKESIKDPCSTQALAAAVRQAYNMRRPARANEPRGRRRAPATMPPVAWLVAALG